MREHTLSTERHLVLIAIEFTLLLIMVRAENPHGRIILGFFQVLQDSFVIDKLLGNVNDFIVKGTLDFRRVLWLCLRMQALLAKGVSTHQKDWLSLV